MGRYETKKTIIFEPFPVETYEALLKAAHMVSKDVMEKLLPLDLTGSQYGVLQTLYTKGPMCQRVIALCVLKTTGGLTPTIDKLEDKSLINRIRMKDDRRYTRIELTPKGRTLVKKIFPKHQKRIMETMEGLTKTDQEHLKRICQNLLTKKKKA